jgi:hypothetical protein
VPRRGQQFFILAIWAAVMAIAQLFVPRLPVDDDDHTLVMWALAFVMPWFWDTILVLLIVSSLDERKRHGRLWIARVWTLIVACFAWIQIFQPVLRLPATERTEWLRDNLPDFAFPWLFGLLFVLWLALSLEKKIADRSLLA